MGVALLFGGAGFIGSHLAASLVARGEDVVVADTTVTALVPGVRYVHCDVRQEIPVDLVGRADTVYNLAAVHRVPGHEDHEYFDTNVAGAHNVVAYCVAADVSSLVFTSSISVYGPTEEPRDERSELSPTTAYGHSKRAAEEIHCAWAVSGPDRRLVIVRPAVVFGAGEGGNFTRLARALRNRTFVYPGRSDTVKSCGYVGELVRTMQWALEQGERQLLYNFCYPEAYTTRQICEAFNRVGGLPKPPLTIPARPMMAVGRAFGRLEAAGLRTGIHPERVAKLMLSTFIRPGVLVERGYDFETDLDEGLRRWHESPPAGAFR